MPLSVRRRSLPEVCKVRPSQELQKESLDDVVSVVGQTDEGQVRKEKS